MTLIPGNRDHHPTDEHHEEHLQNSQVDGVRDVLRRNVLPHTEVPAYLAETPMQEQQRHLDSFHRNQPHANQGFDGASGGFARPGMGDNLDLITRNLADDERFAMRHRAADAGTVTTGDGTPDTVVEN